MTVLPAYKNGLPVYRYGQPAVTGCCCGTCNKCTTTAKTPVVTISGGIDWNGPPAGAVKVTGTCFNNTLEMGACVATVDLGIGKYNAGTGFGGTSGLHLCSDNPRYPSLECSYGASVILTISVTGSGGSHTLNIGVDLLYETDTFHSNYSISFLYTANIGSATTFDCTTTYTLPYVAGTGLTPNNIFHALGAATVVVSFI